MTNAKNSLSIALMSEDAGPAKSWVHLVPSGSFNGIDGRGPYRLEDADAVITASRAYAGKRKMVLDYEHQSIRTVENGKPAPAAGWIVGLQKRENGIWGLVEWTDAAAQAVAKREYRYISPVIFHTPDGKVTAIQNAALTNTPNLDQLTALSRAEEPSMEPDQLAAMVRSAAALVGLPETSEQSAVIARLREVCTVAAEISALTGDTTLAAQGAEPDPAKYVPIGDFERAVADANKLRQGITVEAAKHRVANEIKSGRLAPYLGEWAIALCTSNMPSFDAFLERVGPAFNKIVEPSRYGGKPTIRAEHSQALSDEETEVCRNMGISPSNYAAARRGAAANEV